MAPVPAQVKRSYRSPLREERARTTRRRVREAAARLFVEHGYGQTTVRTIAEKAGVAPRTVHVAYPGGKLEIFQDALNVAVAGDERPVSQAERMQSSGMLDSPADLVEAVVEQASSLLDRAGSLIMTTVTSAGADPDMRRLSDEGTAATRANLRAVAVRLADARLLRPGVDAEHASDVLLALCSPQVHALLRGERGWDTRAYRAWLEDTVRRTLLTQESYDDAWTG